MVSLPKHLAGGPVGRDRLPRGVRTEYQRERVLAAATGVFAERGYQATTVDQIVAAAEIGVGSFYSLFDGKEACFLATYDRVVAAGRERVATAQPADGPWAERVAAVLWVLLETLAADPLAGRVALVEAQAAGAAALARHERNLECVAALLRRGRELSANAGELPPTLELATVGCLAWLLQQRVASGELAAEALFPDVLAMAVEPYLGEAGTRELAARL